MLKGKGQVTLFVIIGLVLLLVAGLIFFISKISIGPVQNDFSKRNQELVESQIRPCARALISSTAQITAASGFFANYEEFGYAGVPVLYISENSLLKKKEFVEKEFEKRFDRELIECISNFSRIENLTTGVIQFEDPLLESKISIGDTYITASIQVHATIISSDESYSIQDIYIEEESTLGSLYKATQIATNIQENDYFDKDEFDIFLKKEELYGFVNLGSIPNSIEFSISEQQGKNSNDPLFVQFLVIV